MSEYFLADTKAEERARQKGQPQAESVKVTLLGDFLFPSVEPQGCDPYNSTQGKSAGELWRTRHDRR
ncbi:MAG TPA: hypothetical protein VMF52_05425 [Steroidobacteraceae bacterium]|nr:hypothetical protein [Steroidobacteraceae bacterium]